MLEYVELRGWTADDFYSRYDRLEYTYEVRPDILNIHIVAAMREGDGAYRYVMPCLWSLKDGKELELPYIAFRELFTPAGYLDFLNKYWVKDAKRACDRIPEESKNPDMFLDDIHNVTYSLHNDTLCLDLNGDYEVWNSTYEQPSLYKELPVRELQGLLSPLGKYLLFESD